MFLTSLNFILLLRVVITPSIITTRSNRTKIRLVFPSRKKIYVIFQTLDILPSTLDTLPSTLDKNLHSTSRGLVSMVRTLLLSLFTGNYLFQVIIIKQNKNFLLFLLPQQTRLLAVSFFTARSPRQTMISFV